jgi:hypothetical protein
MNKNSNKWWSEELTILRHRVCNARRKYQRCQTRRRGHLRDIYLSIDKQYKELMEKNKNKSWREFLRESSEANPWGLAYKIAKDKIFQPKLSELVDAAGNLVIEETKIASQLFDTLFPTDDIMNENENHKQIRAQSLIQSTGSDDDPFSESEVIDIINSQNAKRAPGDDAITADIIIKTHGINRTFLTRLYNKCLELNYFPKIWRKSVIKIIPKPNKSDYRDPNAYRPISLLPVHAKILEKLLINRIT